MLLKIEVDENKAIKRSLGDQSLPLSPNLVFPAESGLKCAVLYVEK